MTKQDSVVAVQLEQQMHDRLIEHKHCIDKQGQDTPAIRILKRMEPIGSNAGQKSFEAIEKDREPMHESQDNRRQQVAVDGEHIHHDDAPYWKRAHRDWRFWLGMCLMLGAIFVYFMSDDLSLVPSSQPQAASHPVKK